MTRNPYSLAVLAALLVGSGWAGADEFKVETTSRIGDRLPPAQYANAFGCTGDNRSPQIAWSGAPEGTKSFVVTMYDPDAPTGSGWWHWSVANIPAMVRELPAGTGSESGLLPSGAVAIRGDAGSTAYFGACPPVGETHRYQITVHALKVDRLDFPADASPALVGFLVHVNRLSKATITLLGSR